MKSNPTSIPSAGLTSACTQDIAGRYASVLFGVTNAGASLMGSVAVALVGVVLDATGSWSAVFQAVAAVNLASAALYLTCATSEPLFE